MSTTGTNPSPAPTASDVAGQLREAGFVRLVGAATGDGLAACGVLARALAARDAPFQVSLAGLATDADRATDADLTVAVGRADATADVALPGDGRPASETAAAVADELDAGDDALALAVAGAVVADGPTDTALFERAREAFDRRPGVAVPVTDLADGLAHSTLVHAPFSGDLEAASERLAAAGLPTDTAELDEDDHRRLASLVALETVGDDAVPPRGGEAVERALHPLVGGPVETLGGYADVLDAVARERPGTGVALALGHDVIEDALAAWREHARAAHAGLRSADTGRYDGLWVVRPADPEVPVGTVARLAHAYRSPEPVTLVATDGAAAVAADHDLGSTVRTAADAIDGAGEATGTTGRARFDGPAAGFVTAYREAQP
jgi:hypothetical protein